MMERCIYEIESLRRERDNLIPGAQAFELISKIMAYIPGPNRHGATEDFAWVLRREMKIIQERMVKTDE